jgi:hypothetical protein
MAINDDGNRLKELRERRLVNSYIIDAQLGRETYNNEIDGKVIHTFPFGKDLVKFAYTVTFYDNSYP